MSPERIAKLLDRMRQAAADAHRMIENVSREEFIDNLVLQRAVGMSLLMASEIASQLLKACLLYTSPSPRDS